jgi:hypothetical protein
MEASTAEREGNERIQDCLKALDTKIDFDLWTVRPNNICFAKHFYPQANHQAMNIPTVITHPCVVCRGLS